MKRRGGKMLKQLSIVLLSTVLCFGQTRYQLTSLTGNEIHRYARAQKLSDNGSAIGIADAASQPVVFTPTRGTVYSLPASSLNGINAEGVVIGTTLFGAPFLSEPPYDSNDVIDLSQAVGSPTGHVTAINDYGDIVGSPYLPNGWFPGLNVSLQAINNARQVIGATVGNSGSPVYFLFTPGKGDSLLPAYPLVLNNKGDILSGMPGAQYIQTNSGPIPLPSAYTWVGMNDMDEVVGFLTPNPSGTPAPAISMFYFSTFEGIVDLSTQFVNTHAIVSSDVIAINNRGEVLFNYGWNAQPGSGSPPAAGVGLLVPISGMAAAGALTGRPLLVPRRKTYSVNGALFQRSRQ